jgi:predicted NAD/FAD-binding protein
VASFRLIKESDLKIAVVGSGISGLSCAWILNREHDVHLFEADSRLGGHAHTVRVDDSSAGAASIPIDTGFLVYNVPTYPNLCAFFEALGVDTAESDMSLSVRLQDRNLEWAGQTMNAVFGQRRNLFRPSFYRMLFEIIRFGKESEANRDEAKKQDWTLRELLKERGYSAEFCRDYMVPMGAAIWSTPESRILDFPAAAFLTFFINHQLLQVNGRPVWRTVRNGSIEYVARVAKVLKTIHLSTPVLRVERLASGKVLLQVKDLATGATRDEEFDRVVLATHAPVTHSILQGKSALEEQILSSIRTEENRAVLHQDAKLMPKTRRCWSSWNVVANSNYDSAPKVSLTYYLNLLQPLKTKLLYFVTLNPKENLAHPLREFKYHHPVFDKKAARAQEQLPQIQGNGGVYFAGAWSRYGFHEDGIMSGVNAARMIGVDAPWVKAQHAL